MVEVNDYASPIRPTWCPGCGDYGIWNALKRALAQSGLAPHQVLVVSGIGCGSKTPDYTNVNGLHTLHGRPVPAAMGAKLANHALQVICVHGDGDGYGEGLSHFLNAARRNVDIVDILQNNRVYGLTKGQYSPTSPQGFHSKTSPDGAIEQPVNPLALALAGGATFIARAFTLDLEHTIDVLVRAIEHRGYALVDMLQACVTFNRAYAYDFLRPRVRKVEEEGYDRGDFDVAWKKAWEWGERIPTGVIYETQRPAYGDQVPPLREAPLISQVREWTPKLHEALKKEFV